MKDKMSGPRFFGRLKEHWQKQEKLRFIVIGVYNTVFGYIIFATAYFLLHRHLHYLGILLMAHFLAVSNAFIGHKYLTFKLPGHLLKDYLRFNLTYLGALVIGLIGLPFLVEVCRLHPLISQAILSSFTILSSYLMHKHLSFRRT